MCDYLFSQFEQYLLDNYRESEYTEIMNHFIQSGEYPEYFYDYLNEED